MQSFMHLLKFKVKMHVMDEYDLIVERTDLSETQGNLQVQK